MNNNWYDRACEEFKDKWKQDLNKLLMSEDKPPLGLKPKSVIDKDRMYDIVSAVSRYFAANKKIPIEWIEEYNQLVE